MYHITLVFMVKNSLSFGSSRLTLSICSGESDSAMGT